MTTSRGFFLPQSSGVRGRTKGGTESPDSDLAVAATQAPRIDFDRFLNTIEWNRGEHFGLIGPTGGGKTNMLISLLPLHPFVAVFATKPRDATMDALVQRGGFEKLDRWQGGLPAHNFPRRVIWPDARQLDAEDRQKEVFADALRKIYQETGWTVAIDELFYMTGALKLGRLIQTYYTQARSLEVSLIAATQRPANVPTEMYDQSTHLMFWKTTDRRSLDRLEEINYGNAGLIRRLVTGLDPYQVLYVNTRSGQMFRTKAPRNAIGRG